MEMVSQYVKTHDNTKAVPSSNSYPGYPYEASYSESFEESHEESELVELEELEKELDKVKIADHNWFEAMKTSSFLLIAMNVLVLLTDISLPVGFIPLPFLIYSVVKKMEYGNKYEELEISIILRKTLMNSIES